MALPVILQWLAPDPTLIAPLQSPAVAGPMTLTNPTGVVITNFERTVTLTSAFDNSADTFTIVGKDILGNTITEDITPGPNNNTVESITAFHVITSITTSGGITAVSAGTGTGGNSIWVQLNNFSISFQTSLNFFVTGTVDYSVVRTPSPFNTLRSNTTPPFPPPSEIYVFQVDAALTNATTDEAYAMTIPSTGVQVQFEQDAANTGTVTSIILQQGII